MMSKEKIGFVGLGTMGFAMCYGMYKSGYSMILPTYRKQTDQSGSFITIAPDEKKKTALYDEMLKNGCEGAKSSGELFKKSDYIMLSMPTSKQVELNIYGENGIMENAREATVVIDLTSANPDSTKKIALELAHKGIEYMDCPISGGMQGAINQTLSVMVGGKKEVYEKIRFILETIGDSEKVTYVGQSGAGDSLKCINNFLSCACLLASTEALSVAKKAGIDPLTAAKVIASGGGSSNATSYKFPNLIFKGNPMGMSVDLMLKDINMFIGLAKDTKVPSFFSNAAYQFFDIQSSMGNGDSDLGCVVKMFEEWTGAKLYGIDK